MQCGHLCVECGVRERGYWHEVVATRLVERKLCAHCDGWLHAMQAEYIRKNGRPRNDEEFCAMLALFSIRLETGPWADVRIMEMAVGLAQGGFGPEFAAADYGQKSAWIDMAERALRSELKSAGRPATGA